MSDEISLDRTLKLKEDRLMKVHFTRRIFEYLLHSYILKR